MNMIVRKAASYGIDYLLLAVLTGLYNFCAGVLSLDKSTVDQGKWMIVCAIITIFLLAVYVPYKTNGQTIGEKLMKLQVINDNGKVRTLWQCFVRESLMKFIMAPFFIVCSIIGYLYQRIRAHSYQQQELFHDLLLKTRVAYVG